MRSAGCPPDRLPRVAVIGQGFVGRSVAQQYQGRCDLVTWDRQDDAPYPTADIERCDLVFVCVDTPRDERDGSCDISNVAEAVRRVRSPLTLIKSTVAPGTTDQLSREVGRPMCHSPEFFGEGRHSSADWGSDRSRVDFTIVGGPPPQRAEIVSILTTLQGPHHRFHLTTALDSELIKYMENSYLATKVSFVNEWYEIVHRLGGDWAAVREGWLLDPRVGRSHSAVFDSDRRGCRLVPDDAGLPRRAAGRPSPATRRDAAPHRSVHAEPARSPAAARGAHGWRRQRVNRGQ